MAKRKIDPDKATKAIGQKFKSIRRGRGLTLEQCEELGWRDWSHLQKVESGRGITLKTLIRLCNLYGVHPSEIFEDL